MTKDTELKIKTVGDGNAKGAHLKVPSRNRQRGPSVLKVLALLSMLAGMSTGQPMEARPHEPMATADGSAPMSSRSSGAGPTGWPAGAANGGPGGAMPAAQDESLRRTASARTESGAAPEASTDGGAREGPSDDCFQFVARWMAHLNDGSAGAGATLLAGIATLGLVISTGMVACGLAVWLCGVGWRHAQGQVAHATNQPRADREDPRTRTACPRTRNPQRKGGGAGETDGTYHSADPTLSEPPILDGATLYRYKDGTAGGGGPVLAHRAARATGS